MKHALLSAVCGGMLIFAHAAASAQNPVSGFGMDPEAGFAFKPLSWFDAETFNTILQSKTSPTEGGTKLETMTFVVFRPGISMPDNGAAAMRVDRTMACSPATSNFTVTQVLAYKADGSVLSTSDRLPASLAKFVPDDQVELRELAWKCQPGRPYPSGLITIATKESPSRRLPSAEPPSPQLKIEQVPLALLELARKREADYAMARALPMSGRFVLMPGPDFPVIIDLAGRVDLGGNEVRVTVVGIPRQEPKWALRTTGRVNCVTMTAVPEHQTDYDAAGLIRNFRNLGRAEYKMPGIDSYGAMFAPACDPATLANDRTVYPSMMEAVEAARSQAPAKRPTP